MHDSVSDRLEAAIKETGLSLKEFALKCDIPYRTLQSYIAGEREPGAINLNKISTIVHASLDWIITGKKGGLAELEGDTSLPQQQSSESEFVLIPQVRGSVSAGGGLEPDNTIEMSISFRRDWLQRKGDHKSMAVIRVQGDSMEPTLLSGDIVLVDLSRKAVDYDGGIYVIAIDGDVMIKRVQKDMETKTLKIICDNTRYDAKAMDPGRIFINGKVIWFGRELER